MCVYLKNILEAYTMINYGQLLGNEKRGSRETMFYSMLSVLFPLFPKMWYYFPYFYLKKKKRKKTSLRTATSRPTRISKLPWHLLCLKLLNHIYLVLQLLVYRSCLR